MPISRYYIIIIVVTILSSLSFAQMPDTLWTRTYGGEGYDEARALIRTFDGDILIAGSSNSFSENYVDIYLLLVNSNGDTIWSQNYDIENTHNYVYSVCQAEDSGFVVCGIYGEWVGTNEAFILKVSKDGLYQWHDTFGPNYIMKIECIRRTFDGGFILSGRLGQSEGYYLRRMNSNGDTLWTGVYPSSYNTTAYSVVENPDNSFTLVGTSGCYSEYGSWDVDIVTVDEHGDQCWQQTYGEFYYDFQDIGRSIIRVNGWNYLICGATESFCADSFPINTDLWLLYCDRYGDTLWTKCYGDSLTEYGYSAIEAITRGYVAVGYTESFGCGGSDMYIVRTDEYGDTVWTGTVGGPNNDVAMDVISDRKYYYYAVGYTNSFGNGGSDIYLVKFRDSTTNIEHDESAIQLPGSLTLYQNYPNPFNASTTISFQLDKPSRVNIDIYDVLGNHIDNILTSDHTAGVYKINYDGSSLSSGVYFYRINAGGFSTSKRMVLIK